MEQSLPTLPAQRRLKGWRLGAQPNQRGGVRSTGNQQNSPDSIGRRWDGNSGVVDAEKGVMLSEAVNIPDWKGRNLKAELERVLGIPAFIENDANAAGLGEFVFGAGKDAKSLVFVALGTGIGGAVIINGELIHGVSFAAGELGHISVDPNGLKCGCGNYGCIELYASGHTIAQRAREFVLAGVNTKLTSMCSPEELTAEHVAKAAQEGDFWLNRFWLSLAGF